MGRVKNVNPVLSYKNLRRVIGILGMALPFICILGGLLFASLPVQKSVSFYYHTNVRDFLVGLLVCVSLFLMTYRGYELIDTLICSISGIVGFGIAIFPCIFADKYQPLLGFFQLEPYVSDIIHLSCSIAFFLLLGINSIFIFTKTDKTRQITANKVKRNVIYVICGAVIIAALLLMIILNIILSPSVIDTYRIIFILETIMLVAFGISWLVKGGTIFPDPKPDSAS